MCVSFRLLLFARRQSPLSTLFYIYMFKQPRMHELRERMLAARHRGASPKYANHPPAARLERPVPHLTKWRPIIHTRPDRKKKEKKMQYLNERKKNDEASITQTESNEE